MLALLFSVFTVDMSAIVAVFLTVLHLAELSTAQLWPRQTSSFTNTSLSQTTTPTTTLASVITPPPCCWVLGGDKAVFLNSWYQQHTYSEIVATIVRTVLQYDDTTFVANSSTRFANATFSSFGFYGGDLAAQVPTQTDHEGSVTVPGVPINLVSGDFGAGGYAGTIVYRATETTVDVSAGIDL